MGRSTDDDDQNDEDGALWADFSKDIKPIKGRATLIPAKSVPRRPAKKPATPKVERTATKPVPPKAPPQLDGSTESKLRKGKLAIEGRLDLHGMTQVEAQDALEAFVLRAAKAGKRCLLVITGKGLSKGEGILRQRLPQWIALAPLSGIILKAVPAAPKDGGSGAFYLYLRRPR